MQWGRRTALAVAILAATTLFGSAVEEGWTASVDCEACDDPDPDPAKVRAAEDLRRRLDQHVAGKPAVPTTGGASPRPLSTVAEFDAELQRLLDERTKDEGERDRTATRRDEADEAARRAGADLRAAESQLVVEEQKLRVLEARRKAATSASPPDASTQTWGDWWSGVSPADAVRRQVAETEQAVAGLKREIQRRTGASSYEEAETRRTNDSFTAYPGANPEREALEALQEEYAEHKRKWNVELYDRDREAMERAEAALPARRAAFDAAIERERREIQQLDGRLVQRQEKLQALRASLDAADRSTLDADFARQQAEAQSARDEVARKKEAKSEAERARKEAAEAAVAAETRLADRDRQIGRLRNARPEVERLIAWESERATLEADSRKADDEAKAPTRRCDDVRAQASKVAGEVRDAIDPLPGVWRQQKADTRAQRQATRAERRAANDELESLLERQAQMKAEGTWKRSNHEAAAVYQQGSARRVRVEALDAEMRALTNQLLTFLAEHREVLEQQKAKLDPWTCLVGSEEVADAAKRIGTLLEKLEASRQGIEGSLASAGRAR